MTGVLAGIEDEAGADLRDVEAFVGTSAGAIVAARLAAGDAAAPAAAARRADAGGARGRRRRRGLLRDARPRWGWAATSPLAPVATALVGARRGARALGPAVARARHRAHARRGCTTSSSAPGARFDGRLRVCCVDRRSGRRVVFGAPGAPRATVADAVTASCAIPWVFAPVRDRRARVRRRRRVERHQPRRRARRGRDTEVLCLDPTALAALAAAPGLPRGHRDRAAGPAPARRARAPRRPRRRGGRGDGDRLHGHGPVRRGARGRAPPGPRARLRPRRRAARRRRTTRPGAALERGERRRRRDCRSVRSSQAGRHQAHVAARTAHVAGRGRGLAQDADRHRHARHRRRDARDGRRRPADLRAAQRGQGGREPWSGRAWTHGTSPALRRDPYGGQRRAPSFASIIDGRSRLLAARRRTAQLRASVVVRAITAPAPR